jgi:hypothetical protein
MRAQALFWMHSLTLVHSQLLGRGTVEDHYFVDKLTLCIGFTHHSHLRSTTTAASSLLILEIPLPYPDFQDTQFTRCHSDEVLYVILVDVCESRHLSYNATSQFQRAPPKECQFSHNPEGIHSDAQPFNRYSSCVLGTPPCTAIAAKYRGAACSENFKAPLRLPYWRSYDRYLTRRQQPVIDNARRYE